MSHVQIAEMLLESGLAREEMTEVIDLLLPLDDLVAEVPTPSDELAALMGADQRPASLAASRRSAVATALVLALTGVGATGLSAAANTLPRPLQHKVSQFSQHYLPFDLPEPPPARPRSQSLPLLPAPGVDPSAGHGEDSASRSIPSNDRPNAAPPLTSSTDHAQPSPAAQPSALPSAGPSYAAQSAGPGTTSQPNMSGSPTPTDRPRDGSTRGPDNDPGQDGKGKGHQTAPPNPDQGGDTGKDPGKGHDKGGKPSKPGPGGQNPVPAPSIPGPTLPQPDPQPDPPVPTIPLPDPLPDLPIGGTGVTDDGLLGLN
jgi:hypothetical protein